MKKNSTTKKLRIPLSTYKDLPTTIMAVNLASKTQEMRKKNNNNKRIKTGQLKNSLQFHDNLIIRKKALSENSPINVTQRLAEDSV